MKIAFVGLGKMGANMTRRAIRGGHEVTVFDVRADAVAAMQQEGASGVSALDELPNVLDAPRVVWVMLPAGEVTDQTIQRLAEHLSPGDLIIDGGNSNYKDTQRRAEELRSRGFRFADVGTSGGVWGLSQGYSMMIGAEDDVMEMLRPVVQSLAPAPDKGWGRVGPPGSGHFVKMVHNGIEYGMMQAYAEGFDLLGAKREFNLDLNQIAEIWRHGSVVRSWLLDLTARALEENPQLDGIAPYVTDSGEGRWTVVEAIDLNVAIPVISIALQLRFRSRDETQFADKLLAAMRQQFGGHAVKRAE